MRRRKPYSAYNRDMVHAKIVVTIAFRQAQEKIRLLSNMLDAELYASKVFMNAAKGFVGDRGGRLNILVETDIDETHPLRRLANEYPENVSIKRVPDEVVETYPFNFMIIDEIGFRVETDRDEPKALVVVHDTSAPFTDHMGLLDNIFGSLDESASPI